MKNENAFRTQATAETSNFPVALVEVNRKSSLPQHQASSALAGQHSSDRDRLIMEHQPMVRFIARKICERLPQHVEFEEVVSAGIVGLIDAVHKFDPRKDVQFKSYAQFRIRGAILDSLRTLDWSPRDLRRRGRAIEEAIRVLTARLGRVPTDAEMACEMNLSLVSYQQLLGEVKNLEIGSLNVGRSAESGEEELACLPASASDDPLLRCMEGEMREFLIAAIDTLPEKERLVLTLYYYEELTMKEIGLTLGVVESRISQIHASAVHRLRKALEMPKASKARGDATALQN